MKNLIMGVAKGYGFDVVEPFVTSCKKFCPDAELVLFVDDISDFTRDRLIKGGAILEQFPVELKSGIPNNTRWKVFADYLAAHGDDYAQVFISDTRDVIFQGDLFAPFKDCTNWLGYAMELTTIGEDMKCNYPWTVDCFGKAEADKLADKQIICDGTVIGSSAALKILATKMWGILSYIESRVDYRIHDQPVMNYLVWNNLLPIENLFEFDVNHGEIFTTDQIYKLYPAKIRGDKILRGDGGIPAVVHQYDRHKDSTQLVNRIYRDKNFTADDRFNDWRTVIEQIRCLLYADKDNEAACFLIKNFSVEKSTYESIYNLIKLWEFVLQGHLNSSAENFQLALQYAFAACEEMPEEHLTDIYKMLTAAMKNNYPVSAHFKEYFTRHLLPVAQRNLDQGNTQACLNCINFLEALNAYRS